MNPLNYIVSFHRTLRNSADSGIQHLEPTEQTKQASCAARFGDPKGRVNEDPDSARRANPSLSAETESVDRRWIFCVGKTHAIERRWWSIQWSLEEMRIHKNLQKYDASEECNETCSTPKACQTQPRLQFKNLKSTDLSQKVVYNSRYDENYSE